MTLARTNSKLATVTTPSLVKLLGVVDGEVTVVEELAALQYVVCLVSVLGE